MRGAASGRRGRLRRLVGLALTQEGCARARAWPACARGQGRQHFASGVANGALQRPRLASGSQPIAPRRPNRPYTPRCKPQAAPTDWASAQGASRIVFALRALGLALAASAALWAAATQPVALAVLTSALCAYVLTNPRSPSPRLRMRWGTLTTCPSTCSTRR